MAEEDPEIAEAPQGFRQAIAVGMSKLGKLAAKRTLPTGNKGEFQDVIEALAERRESMEEALAEDLPVSDVTPPAGIPDAPLDEDGRRLFR